MKVLASMRDQKWKRLVGSMRRRLQQCKPKEMATAEIEHEVKGHTRRQVQVVQPNRARDAWVDGIHNKEVRAFRIPHVNVDGARNVEFVEVILIPGKEINNDRCELLKSESVGYDEYAVPVLEWSRWRGAGGNAPI